MIYNRRNPAALATGPQVQLVRIGQRSLNIDDDTFYDTLMSRYGVEHTRDLNQEQITDLLEDYRERGFTPVAKPGKTAASPGHGYNTTRPVRVQNDKVIALASPEEHTKIAAIAELIEWRAENGLQLFLEKRLAIKRGKVRTARDAFRAIEALKKLFENHMKKTHGDGWWAKRYPDAGITAYIAIHKPAEYR